MPCLDRIRDALSRGLPLAAGCTALGLACAASDAAAQESAPCSARSGATAPTVVELYTSEGCNSCPPAERWVSGLAASDGVVALAFHVDYWDGLGWKDRWAQAAYSQRQVASQRTTGARFAYTPQVVVDGRDTPDWPHRDAAALAATRHAAAPVALELDGQHGAVALRVTPVTPSSEPWTGYLAVVDDGLVSRPDAGENRGAVLKEDGVVRSLQPWRVAGTGAQPLTFTLPAAPPPGTRRRIVAVATAGEGGRPIQAVTLACAP